MNGPEVITFGCRLNIAESEAMRMAASKADDLVIVNSCAVTAEAVRQARQAIRRVKRQRPGARIIVTGCAAQIEPGSFAAMPEVSRVVGNADKFDPASLLFTPDDAPQQVRVSDIMAVREMTPHLIRGFAGHARAFVEVQNGCDHRCTFCVIPYGRGNSRSAPAGLVIDRIKALVDEGYREIVLTGVDITSYGPDLPGSPTLGTLVKRILDHVPDLPRLRLSSIDSVEIDEVLLETICSEERLMPHLHLSLQAGDDMILKRMKRRHNRAQAIRFCETVRKHRPEIAFGADLIAGFPTESDEMFENTLALIDECDIVYGHIFPYSARQGTPAARMPQVPVPVRKERAQRLRAKSAERLDRWLRSLVGSTQQLLIERHGLAHSPAFAPARLAGGGEPGTLVDARITGIDNGVLQAVAA